MNQVRALTPRVQKISIAGREFWIKEYVAKDIEKYLMMLAEVSDKSVEAVMAAGGDGSIAKLDKAPTEELFLFMLRHPADDGPLPDADWLDANVTRSMRSELKSIVEEVNSIDETLGNVERLLEIAQAKVQAQELAQAQAQQKA